VPRPEEFYGLQYAEQTTEDGSVNFLGAKIISKEGKIEMSVFDKTKEWNFPVIRYCHGESNSPLNQSRSFYLGQMIRYYNICNNLKSFKIATSSLTLRLLERKHCVLNLKKAWNKFLIKYYSNHLNRQESIKKWFRKMLTWCTYQMHRPQWSLKDKQDPQTVQSLVPLTICFNSNSCNNTSSYLITTYPNSASYSSTSFRQNHHILNNTSTSDNSTSLSRNLHILNNSSNSHGSNSRQQNHHIPNNTTNSHSRTSLPKNHYTLRSSSVSHSSTPLRQNHQNLNSSSN
jgi:hypothetical protein